MRSLFWLPLLFVLTSGCSLKNRTDFRGISVQLPSKELSVARLSHHEVSAKENSSFVTPSTIGDFQCFALNVVGNGIPFDSRFSCKNSLSKIGIVGGFIPLTQNVIEMMVPVGSNRTIQLIGVQSSIGCPNFNDFFLLLVLDIILKKYMQQNQFLLLLKFCRCIFQHRQYYFRIEHTIYHFDKLTFNHSPTVNRL
jgi:hypothetical protein